MRLPMKFGVSLANHDALAQAHVAEVRDRVDGGVIRLRRRNNLQQPHVARRIKEVRAKPRAAELVGESFGNFAHGQPAGVGRHDGPGLADGFDFSQQSPLDIEVLDHGFDDPVHVSQFLQSSSKLPTVTKRASDGSMNAAGLDFFAASSPAAAILFRAGASASGGTMSNR